MDNQEVPNTASEKTRIIHCLFFTLFLLSGAAGLIYQVVWVRQFTAVFGASAFAVSIVLAAFMTGMGVGAWFIGRWVDSFKRNRLMRLYVSLEITIGSYALLLPFALRWAETVYVGFYRVHQPGGLTFYGFKMAMVFILLLVPTILIGATLPVMTRYIVREKSRISLTVSRLYAANTLGAIIGTVAAGYILLPYAGIRLTTWIAVGINFLVAALFWAIHTFDSAKLAEQKTVLSKRILLTDPQVDPQAATAIQKAVVFGFCISGAAAMLYEVSWTRVLCMILGTTTYAFTTMLAAFLVGITLGSFIYGLIPASISRVKLFVALELLVGFSVLFSIPGFGKLPFVYLSLHSRFVNTWADVQVMRFALSALVMLVPTIAMGILFPVVSSILIDSTAQLGRRLGKAYGLNTFGATVGAAAAGLLLVPTIGMQKTIILGAILNFIAAISVHLIRTDLALVKRAATGAVYCTAAAITIFAIHPWSPRVINSGAYVYADRYKQMLGRYQSAAEKLDAVPALNDWKVWEMAMKQYKLLYYKPGLAATVAVMEKADGGRFLTIDGKTDASTGEKSDMRTQVMIGQLPLLFHPQPDEVFVVGLGSGVTVGSVLTHDVRVVDCAEISPAVIEASNFFRHVNRNALDEERLRIIPQDARNTLLITEKRYDVIISQPSNPWVSGESNLFSCEWYRLVRDRLKTDGLFLQWVPAYLMTEQDLKVIVHTLRSVFGELSVWSSGSVGDLILLARKEGALQIDFKEYLNRIRNERIQEDIYRIGVDPLLIPFQLFVMNEKDLSAYLYSEGGKPLQKNTDDLLITEFTTPKELVSSQNVSRFVDPERLRGKIGGVMEILFNTDEREILELLQKRKSRSSKPI